MRSRHHDARAVEDVVGQVPHALPAPDIARLLDLQRSAGNHAVARVLARLEEKELGAIHADEAQKKIFEDAQLKWHMNFGPKAPYRESDEYEDWNVLVAQAATLEALVQDVDRRVADAKLAVGGANKKKQQKKKQQGAAKKFVTFVPPPSKTAAAWSPGSVPTSVTAQSPNATPPPPVALPAVPQFNLATHTNRIAGWSPNAHGGWDISDLSLTRVRQIITWIQNDYNRYRDDRVWLRRGPGSGQWTGAYQIKIIHKTVTVPGVPPKKATFHLTVSANVYAQLGDVAEVGAEWTG